MNKGKNTPVRKVFLALIYPVSALFLLLLAGEAACRLYLAIKFGRPSHVSYVPFGYEREPLLGFEMVPNLRDKYLKYLKTTFSTNSRGFRGREEYSGKEKGEIRVAVLGESCAFGYGASGDDATIAGYLKKGLEERFPRRKITVINAANPGYTSYQVLAKFQLRVIDLQPDFIVPYMGWNDLFYSSYHLPYERNSFYGKDFYFAMDSWQSFIQAKNRDVPEGILRPFASTIFFKKICARLRSAGPAAQDAAGEDAGRIVHSRELRDEISAQFYDNFSSLLAIAKSRGIKVVALTLFSDTDLYHEDRSQINRLIMKAVEAQGAHLIDMDKLVSVSHTGGINLPYDDYHLTDKGNRFLAGLVSGKIAELAGSQGNKDIYER